MLFILIINHFYFRNNRNIILNIYTKFFSRKFFYQWSAICTTSSFIGFNTKSGYSKIFFFREIANHWLYWSSTDAKWCKELYFIYKEKKIYKNVFYFIYTTILGNNSTGICNWNSFFKYSISNLLLNVGFNLNFSTKDFVI